MFSIQRRSASVQIGITALALLILLLLSACGTSSGSSGTSGGSSPAPAAPTATPTTPASATPVKVVQVKMIEKDEKYSFEPAAITIPKGAQVVWTNTTDAPHTVTSDSNAFTASSNVTQNQTFMM